MTEVFLGLTSTQIFYGCLGGFLISLASTIHLWLMGRVTGMSGILSGIVTFDSKTFYWKVSILLAMISTSSYVQAYHNESNRYFESSEEFKKGLSVLGFVITGMLVGIGTKLGNGCTSGHGVCGLPRFSKRSFVAVMTFFSVGVLTATLKDQYRGSKLMNLLEQESGIDLPDQQRENNPEKILYICLGLFLINTIISIVKQKKFQVILDIFVSAIVGVIFTLGLIFSGMVKRHVVLGFLTLNKDWNPTLLFVLGCAVVPNIISFNLILNSRKKSTPLLQRVFQVPNSQQIDAKLIIGAILFGIGWGLSGICPGPSFCLVPTSFAQCIIAYFLISQIVGNQVASLYQKEKERLNINKKIKIQ